MSTADRKSQVVAPDIGALFEYRDQRYRVTGWMCRHEEPPEDDYLAHILWEAQQKVEGIRMRWCRREEATHVTGAGVAGCIARVQDIQLQGMVDWPASQLEDARRDALHLVGMGLA